VADNKVLSSVREFRHRQSHKYPWGLFRRDGANSLGSLSVGAFNPQPESSGRVFDCVMPQDVDASTLMEKSVDNHAHLPFKREPG
jgi:hypothetical protein